VEEKFAACIVQIFLSPAKRISSRVKYEKVRISQVLAAAVFDLHWAVLVSIPTTLQ
jgi:hypothetical protein